MSIVRRIAGIVVVNQAGQILLQERDEFAPIHPNSWGMCGGSVEPGETFHEGALRELAEETGLTGLRLSEALAFELSIEHPQLGPTLEQWRVYVAPGGDLTDADIVLGEGRQIIFRDPAMVEDDTVDIPPKIRPILRAALASPAFAACLATQSSSR